MSRRPPPPKVCDKCLSSFWGVLCFCLKQSVIHNFLVEMSLHLQAGLATRAAFCKQISVTFKRFNVHNKFRFLNFLTRVYSETINFVKQLVLLNKTSYFTKLIVFCIIVIIFGRANPDLGQHLREDLNPHFSSLHQIERVQNAVRVVFMLFCQEDHIAMMITTLGEEAPGLKL